MKYLVLGAGQMGRAIAFDLLRDEEAEVVVADNDPHTLEDVYSWLDDPRADIEVVEADDRGDMQALMADADVCISAFPFRYNIDLLADAIATGTHFCDLGGNNDVVQTQLELDQQAREAGIVAIPDCGLAPGLAGLLAADACDRLTRVSELHIRVGGLPQRPQGELEYMLTFSVEGLLNEYSESCLALRDGDLVSMEPLTDVETMNFPEPWGELEAFNTSGGLSTLPQSLGHKVENMDYKTIRFPGHAAKVRALLDQGMFSTEPKKLADGREVVPRELLAKMFEETCDYQEADVVLLRIHAIGSKNNVGLSVKSQIVDRFDKENGITAMMRMTGYPTAIIARMMATGDISVRGVVPGERCVPMELFRQELKARDIHMEEVVRVTE